MLLRTDATDDANASALARLRLPTALLPGLAASLASTGRTEKHEDRSPLLGQLLCPSFKSIGVQVRQDFLRLSFHA